MNHRRKRIGVKGISMLTHFSAVLTKEQTMFPFPVAKPNDKPSLLLFYFYFFLYPNRFLFSVILENDSSQDGISPSGQLSLGEEVDLKPFQKKTWPIYSNCVLFLLFQSMEKGKILFSAFLFCSFILF